MEEYITRYQKYLTLQDRYEIEEGLNTNHTLTDIAEMLARQRFELPMSVTVVITHMTAENRISTIEQYPPIQRIENNSKGAERGFP